jgi:hypothetical protein
VLLRLGDAVVVPLLLVVGAAAASAEKTNK